MKLSAEPRSDQINADDLIAGPQTFTIAGVGYGKATAKYDVELVESPGRCWRPPLTMLRLLFKAWGDEAGVWVGRRVTLFTDPSVTFGKDKVGGIRISHLSHIDKTVSINPQVTRGKRKLVSAEPLIEQAPQAVSLEIPQHVRDTVESISDPGTLEDYIAHITSQNAPAHIIEWARNQKKDQ